jgi:hypothetical protein
VITTEDEAGGSRNVFFRSNSSMAPMAHREERGMLVVSSHDLRLILPSAGRAYRLLLPISDPETSPALRVRTLEASALLDSVRQLHGIPEETAIEGFEVRSYSPALEGLGVGQLLEHSDADFRATWEGLRGPEGRRLGDMDALFQDNPDQPNSSCTSTTSSDCNITCMGGSFCSITCTNGRCASCTCDKDVPTCTCNN